LLFRLREALRPLELARLLSLGALVEESLSTRLDSVRAPDRLCVEEDLLEPDARLREFPRERLFDEDDRLFDFDELRELPERLLLDRDFCWGILPGSSQYLSFSPSILQYGVGRLPASRISNTRCGSFRFKGAVSGSNPQLSG
jgi:hypothetical protein